ncbi:hypothetical protein DRQ00_09900 [candidate division KSB1 bacterium]|nr:MAG: hypothetical protein DRQ00_09900 [candidate division KSB1 bacterium]
MENLEVNERDLRKFFASYWLLHSAIYNFAQGFNNQRKRRFTWAITNYYYSLVFVGRLFMFLAADLYYTGHSDIANFFIGNEVKRRRGDRKRGAPALKFNKSGEFESIDVYGNPGDDVSNTSTDDIISYRDITSNLSIDIEKIEKFGKVLNQLKNFRNKNTYEAFVIYAQECHTILTEFIFSATDKVREVAERHLKEACKVFFNFWRRKSEQFVSLLNHKWIIPMTLQILRKHYLPAEYIKAIINRGFYFENEEIYRKNLIRVRSIMERKPGTDLNRRFEEICSITSFRAKQAIIDDVFSDFKELIEIDGREN